MAIVFNFKKRKLKTQGPKHGKAIDNISHPIAREYSR